MQTELLSQRSSAAVEAPAEVVATIEVAAPDAHAAPERISERGWFLRGVMMASLLLIAGFWAGVGMAVATLLP